MFSLRFLFDPPKKGSKMTKAPNRLTSLLHCLGAGRRVRSDASTGTRMSAAAAGTAASSLTDQPSTANAETHADPQRPGSTAELTRVQPPTAAGKPSKPKGNQGQRGVALIPLTFLALLFSTGVASANTARIFTNAFGCEAAPRAASPRTPTPSRAPAGSRSTNRPAMCMSPTTPATMSRTSKWTRPAARSNWNSKTPKPSRKGKQGRSSRAKMNRLKK